MPAARASFAHDPLEDSGPSAPGVARDESRQRCGVGKPERLRLLYGPLDVMAVEDGRQVEQRARDRVTGMPSTPVISSAARLAW
jgi:hypothetical protein